MQHIQDKILALSKLIPQIQEFKKQGKTIVFTNGCFDLLHSGHLKILTQSKAQGDILIVALNSDSSVKILKGETRPINEEAFRSSLLASLFYVDFVILFDEETPLKLIQHLRPDVLVKGGDYQIKEIVGSEIVLEHGGKVLTIPLVEGKSTTNIIEKLKS